MSQFEIASILITLAALCAYMNYRFLRLPTTIGVMLIAMVCSVGLIAVGHVEQRFHAEAARLVAGIDFQRTVLHVMLAFLLFAGALQLKNLDALKREWDVITILALVGTVISTFLVAGLSWWTFRAMGLTIPPIYCLLFGTLISPTDPIAVLAIMRTVHVPKSMETQISGESLFNDGVGVVLFLTVLGVVTEGQSPSWSGLSLLLVREVVGAVVLGSAAGLLVYHLLKSVDNYQVEVLLTLALAMGGFTLAEALGVSAPLTVVIAGLFIGNPGRSFAMSAATRSHLDTFWELIDEILNAILFLLVGLEVLVMPFTPRILMAGMAAIGITLLARWASVGATITAMRSWRKFGPGTITVLTWGGLRGGLSVAMALSLPRSEHREFIVAVTYAVVVFSVFVQGISIGAVIRRIDRLLPVQ